MGILPKHVLISGFIYPVCFAIVLTFNFSLNRQKSRTIADIYADLRSVVPNILYLGWNGDQIVIGISTTKDNVSCVEEMEMSELIHGSAEYTLMSEASKVILRNNL
jgi:hypothetical protein